jgi:hypothetical protein
VTRRHCFTICYFKSDQVALRTSLSNNASTRKSCVAGLTVAQPAQLLHAHDNANVLTSGADIMAGKDTGGCQPTTWMAPPPSLHHFPSLVHMCRWHTLTQQTTRPEVCICCSTLGCKSRRHHSALLLMSSRHRGAHRSLHSLQLSRPVSPGSIHTSKAMSPQGAACRRHPWRAHNSWQGSRVRPKTLADTDTLVRTPGSSAVCATHTSHRPGASCHRSSRWLLTLLS